MLKNQMIGTVVGITNSKEFYFSITPGKAFVQDFVCVDTYQVDENGNKILNKDGSGRKFKVWAKVMEIERNNPLFPEEAGHELAFNQQSAYETVISLSREMITAKCKILGIENVDGNIINLSYPLQPASSVYIPLKEEVESFLIGDLLKYRELSIGCLRSRKSQKISIDAHAIVARHLAVLGSTGAGKTVVVRKILEELIKKNYPILIFDKRGDYIGLKDIFNAETQLYIPNIDVRRTDPSMLIDLIKGLSGVEIEDLQESILNEVIKIIRDDLDGNTNFLQNIIAPVSRNRETNYRLQESHHLWNFFEVLDVIFQQKSDTGTRAIIDGSLRQSGYNDLSTARPISISALRRKVSRAAEIFSGMVKQNKLAAKGTTKLPDQEKLGSIIQKRTISIILFEGYSDEICQSIISIVMQKLFNDRLEEKIPKFLTVIEEAHDYIPSSSEGEYSPAIPIIRNIATQGRKFGVGLVVVSQRPSRINSTILSQCNSFIILKTINPADQQYIKNIVESLGEDDAKLLPDLSTGEALLTGQFIRFPVLVNIEKGFAVGKYEEDDFIKEFL